MYTGIEKRVDPRADIRVAVEVIMSPKDRVALETVNLSLSGALCRSAKILPLNSVVRCRLLLPERAGKPAREIQTEAIVLRVNSGPGLEFVHVTLYFVDTRNEDREALRRFVFDCLQAAPPAAAAPLARKA